jgi:HD-like signal output (HDOD) protein
MEKEAASTILHRLESGYAVRPLSIIALKLIELASDENASIRDMVNLVEKDPSLAVRVLNLANSVAFRGRERIKTLQQAAVRLGAHHLKLMALSISIRDAFPMGRVGPLDYEAFWRVSLYRALMARSLTDRSKVCDPDEAFLASLTLEIGLLILFDLYVKGKNEEISLELQPLDALLARERAHFGVDHRQIGKAALKFWKFPENIIACQTCYGDAAMRVDAPMLARICELSRIFSRLLYHGASGELLAFFSEAQSLLKLRQETIQEILLKTFQEVQETAAYLRLEVDKERDLMEIMEKANRALSRISEKMSRLSKASEERDLPSFEALEGEVCSVQFTLQAVAHEIRNPLTAVGGFARRLASALDSGSQAGKYAQVILAESLRLEKILSDMR